MTKGDIGEVARFSIFGNYELNSQAVHSIVDAIKEAPTIQVTTPLFPRKLTPPQLGWVRAYLPLSGRSVGVKQKGESNFDLRASAQKGRAKLSEHDFASVKRPLESKKDLETFMKVLRLTQLALIGQSSRTPVEHRSRPLALPMSVINAMERLEDFMGQRAEIEELKAELKNLETYHSMWYNQFQNALKEAQLKPADSLAKLLDSKEYEDRFCLLPNADDLRTRDYLNVALNDSITAAIRRTLFDGLSRLYVIESPEVSNDEVLWRPSPFKLRLINEGDMYASQRQEANRLLSLLGTDESDSKNKQLVHELLAHMNGKNELAKLVEKPPSEVERDLESILLSGNFEDVIQERLESQVGGVYAHRKEKSDGPVNIKSLFTETERLRNEITLLESTLARIDKDIESMRIGHDTQMEAGSLQTTWARHRSALYQCKTKKQDIKEAMKDVTALRKEITKLEMDLKKKQTNVNTDGSVLWLGLGQAGQSILRECLLYCLDNLNDARCSALIRSLGVQDLPSLNNMMLRSKNSDRNVRQQAEEELRYLFHRQLHILAMNLGGEIDDLVLEGQPGYFLWGEGVPESEYASVRRKTMNTIKLDPTQDGAGGKTGVGRAFAFGRANELKAALRDVGSKSGHSPSQIIVTHSFAGGSGSGMVLPVLQLLRSIFDSEAMIWVVSVGEGLSEQRISADYNTPFILSDVLQAHYDGIHSAIDPFRVGEWAGYKFELEQYVERMEAILDELQTKVHDSAETTVSDSISALSGSRKQQLEKSREEDLKTLKTLAFSSDSPIKSDSSIEANEDLFAMLPVSDESTEEFNAWCDVYDENGERPAVKFWNAWVNCAVDPLGNVVDCREESKEQRNKQEVSDAYLPHLTSAHIELALDEAAMKLFPEEKHSREMDDEEKKNDLRGKFVNLRMLINYIVEEVSKHEGNKKKEMFRSIREKLEAYGREVDGFNTLRRDLTNRVKSLSKAGNDKEIKSIVISNAHLERGVSNSGIPVEENTYTVYNAVVFDVVMNIIGSQLPSSDYISGKMEYFDRTDLNNHSLPPMAVGLLQQHDTVSLAEPGVSTNQSASKLRTIDANRHASALFDQIFSSTTPVLADELPNPFTGKGYTSGGDAANFFESYFGIRTPSMLQINPYDVVDAQPTSALEALTENIKKDWQNEQRRVANLTYAERRALEQDGFTSYTFNNMLRWLSLVDPKTLESCLSPFEFTSLNTLKELTPTLPNGFVFSEAEKNFELTRYEHESGNVKLHELEKALVQFGILNEELLASAPPSLLNSYLPKILLEIHKSKIVEAFEPTNPNEKGGLQAILEAKVLPALSEVYSPTTLYNPERLGLIPFFKNMEQKGDFLPLQKAFAASNLSIKLVEDEDRRTTVQLRLHPRLTRYFSVFRGVVSEVNTTLYPSISVAGSFARYLASDSKESVIGTYSSPTFSKASEEMQRLAFVGLLPDEQRLSWPSFARLVLFATEDGAKMEDKLGNLAQSVGIDLSKFGSLISKMQKEHPMTKSDLAGAHGPASVVKLSSILANRIQHIDQIEAEYLKIKPNEKPTIDYWRLHVATIKHWELDLHDESSLRFFVQSMLQLVKPAPESSTTMVAQPSEIAEVNGESDEMSPNPSPIGSDELGQQSNELESIDRLFYELATNLSEMLSQSEYMSKEHSADRVHFQMAGFSDRMLGQPKGLLVQVHHASTARIDFDSVKTAVRESVQQSLGFIENSKEFQTKSLFGPRASVTVSLSQAPLNEAATTYKGLMKKLSGNDPEAYIEETKLHPYVFLYNVLWLSASLNKWTNTENVAFARRFVIPLQVIQDHFTQPERIDGAVNVLVKDAIFLKGVSLPQDDIRDYTASKKAEERYRSMRHLVSILALRHVRTCDELAKLPVAGQTFKTDLEEVKQEYNDEIKKLSNDIVVNRLSEPRKGASAFALLLEDEVFGAAGGSTAPGLESEIDPLEALMASYISGSAQGGTADTILERTRAWLNAHKAWESWGQQSNE